MRIRTKTTLVAAVAVLSVIGIVITQNAVAANVEASQTVAGDPLVGAVLMGTVLGLACVFFASVVVLFTTVARVVERDDGSGEPGAFDPRCALDREGV